MVKYLASTDILGVRFSDTVQFSEHIADRISACRRNMYSLQGWAYVILACVPKLKATYGILCGNLRCYMVLKLYHLHMPMLKSLALPKVLMLRAKRLNIYFLARYMAGDGCVDGTLISRVCNLGISPLGALVKNVKKKLMLMLVTLVCWTHFGFSSIVIIMISHGRPTIHWCTCSLRPFNLE